MPLLIQHTDDHGALEGFPVSHPAFPLALARGVCRLLWFWQRFLIAEIVVAAILVATATVLGFRTHVVVSGMVGLRGYPVFPSMRTALKTALQLDGQRSDTDLGAERLDPF